MLVRKFVTVIAISGMLFAFGCSKANPAVVSESGTSDSPVAEEAVSENINVDYTKIPDDSVYAIDEDTGAVLAELDPNTHYNGSNMFYRVYPTVFTDYDPELLKNIQSITIAGASFKPDELISKADLGKDVLNAVSSKLKLISDVAGSDVYESCADMIQEEDGSTTRIYNFDTGEVKGKVVVKLYEKDGTVVGYDIVSESPDYLAGEANTPMGFDVTNYYVTMSDGKLIGLPDRTVFSNK